MPALETTTESRGNTTTTSSKWLVGLLTPQTILYVLAGFASIVIFWNTQKNHTQHLEVVDKVLPTKVNEADFKALVERVNRQYETNNKILERIIDVEKKLSFEAGKAEGEREERRRQRNDNSSRTGN